MASRDPDFVGVPNHDAQVDGRQDTPEQSKAELFYVNGICTHSSLY
jgi:hypothetical protein